MARLSTNRAVYHLFLYFIAHHRHPYLVQILGFCANPELPAIVYEFMYEGDVYNHIHKVNSFKVYLHNYDHHLYYFTCKMQLKTFRLLSNVM